MKLQETISWQQFDKIIKTTHDCVENDETFKAMDHLTPSAI